MSQPWESRGGYPWTSQLCSGQEGENFPGTRGLTMFNEHFWPDKWLCKTLPPFPCAPCVPGPSQCQALRFWIKCRRLHNYFVSLSDAGCGERPLALFPTWVVLMGCWVTPDTQNNQGFLSFRVKTDYFPLLRVPSAPFQMQNSICRFYLGIESWNALGWERP